MQSILARCHCVAVRVICILDVFKAVVEFLEMVYMSRVGVEQDARENLSELPTVKLGGFPIAQNIAPLQRDELVEQLSGEEGVQGRRQLLYERMFFDERHRKFRLLSAA